MSRPGDTKVDSEMLCVLPVLDFLVGETAQKFLQTTNDEVLSNMLDDTINICLAFSDKSGKYYEYAATTMLSVVQNTKSKIAFHIIHDETLTKRAYYSLSSVSTVYDAEILFYPVDSKRFVDINIPGAYRFGLGSFYRLFIPELIVRNVVVYFDCDILCNIDVLCLMQSFYSTPGQCIGAIQDSCVTSISSLRKTMKKKGFDCNRYFNSGVIVYDVAEVKSLFRDFTSAALRIVKEQVGARFIDQDALNIIFRKIGIKWLDGIYNYQMNLPGRLLQYEESLQSRILHFSGTKPWDVPQLPASLLFTKYYIQFLQIQKELKIV